MILTGLWGYIVVSVYENPDPREHPKSTSLNGGSYKVPLVYRPPNYGTYFLDPPRGSEKQSQGHCPLSQSSQMGGGGGGLGIRTFAVANHSDAHIIGGVQLLV